MNVPMLDMSALERPGRNHTENSTNPNVQTNFWRRAIRSKQLLDSSAFILDTKLLVYDAR